MPKTGIPVFSETESFSSGQYRNFYISSYEDQEAEHLNRVAPHKHTYFEIIWIENGSGTHLIDFVQYPFEGPCLFLLQPANVHQIFKSGPTKGNVIKFTESFFGSGGTDNILLKFDVFDNVEVEPVLQISPEFLPRLKAILTPMMDHFRNPEVVSRSVLEAYLRIFLLEVYQLKKNRGLTHDPASDPKYFLFREFKHLLERSYRENHSVDFYAGQLNISAKTLSEVTVLFTEKAPSHLIRDRLLLESKRMLTNTRLTVKEICFALGFRDPAYFTRFFTKHEALSPVQFRASPKKLF
ncbi:MAG TPA: helix-turn-helix domain-containing protein [Sphingobacteriaceae bacterium]